MIFIRSCVVECIIVAYNYFIMSIYRYLEIEYLGDFITGDIVLAPSNIIGDTNNSDSVRSALME